MDNRREQAPIRDETALTEDPPRPDEAVFAIERLPRGGRGLKAAGIALVAITGFALAGILGNRATPPNGATLRAPDDNVPAVGENVAAASATATRGPAREWTGVKNGDDVVTASLAPPLLAVDAHSSDGMLFVHGDVYTHGAMLVVVSVSDDDYHTLDVRSLNLPGGSTAFRTGPNDRFALAIQLDDGPSRQPAWVRVDAYDHYGGMIASARAPVGIHTT